MLERMIKLAAVVFPGAYRALAIGCVSFIATKSTSDRFSEWIFWVLLLTSLSGQPVAARAMTRHANPSPAQQFLYSTLALALVTLGLAAFWPGNWLEYLIVILAALLLNSFELQRNVRAAAGQFRHLTVCGAVTILLLPVVVYACRSTPEALLLMIFLSLALPLGMLHFHRRPASSPATLAQLLVPITANMLSSGLATALTFVFPLLLIEEWGQSYASSIAQIYAIASMCFLLPRYLSAGYVVKAKQRLTDRQTLRQFSWQNIAWALFCCSAYLLLTYIWFPAGNTFALLFIAMQLSQLSLPYANTLVAVGEEPLAMSINALALVVLAGLMLMVYLALPQGPERGQWFLGLLCLYQGLRMIMHHYIVHSRKLA